jgi:hypothetical protein
MTILRHTVKAMALQTVGQDGGNHAVQISLPAPPCGTLDRDDRRATTPTGRILRADRRWNADPVIAHADKRRDRG